MDDLSFTSTGRRFHRRARTARMRHRPRRDGARWTPEEAARELHRRRPELGDELRRRRESGGIPIVAHDELIADAITAVVMSARPIQNEQHLIGAFWVAVDHRD